MEELKGTVGAVWCIFDTVHKKIKNKNEIEELKGTVGAVWCIFDTGHKKRKREKENRGFQSLVYL